MLWWAPHPGGNIHNALTTTQPQPCLVSGDAITDRAPPERKGNPLDIPFQQRTTYQA